LFELHLVTQEHKVSRASSHLDGIGQSNLSGFIDKQEIEHIFPFRPGEEPGCSPHDTSCVPMMSVSGVLDVLHTGMAHKQEIILVTSDFHAVELNTVFFGGVAAG
jgi:hypothetical protein